jgi:hypothetical protein
MKLNMSLTLFLLLPYWLGYTSYGCHGYRSPMVVLLSLQRHKFTFRHFVITDCKKSKLRFLSGLQQYEANVHTKFHQNPYRGSGVETCERIERGRQIWLSLHVFLFPEKRRVISKSLPIPTWI